ncbi:MAG TPA: TolC family protein [Humidesulfovibrio sp.]|uniref:TolC family protein n=1 Tax=Humidesulfovibrio sp. TaxID=2910988 RepID=UPI002D08EBEB|nr:TolC family protein [Humidesulfovibrio sp.]HWR04157.1 TolC family protein [Humidesulfovibrio sp.]
MSFAKNTIPGAVLRVIACALCLSVALQASPLRADEPNLTTVRGAAGQPMDLKTEMTYADVLNYSLTRLEQLKSTQFDIETAKITEKDVFYKMFPKIVLAATYSFPLQSTKNNQSYMSMGLNSGNYDPIAAYYGRDAAKLAVNGAKMLHVLTVQRFMEILGLAFVNMQALDETIACQKEFIALANEGVEYTTQLMEQGSASLLDLRIAKQRKDMAELELNKTVMKKQAGLAKFKRQLGINELQKVTFDFPLSMQQLLGFNEPLPVDTTAIVERSLAYRLLGIKEQLQRFNIQLAQSEHIPKLGLGVVAPDPLATQKTSNSYYLSVSANVPVWSWGETARNVERAELSSKKTASSNRVEINKMYDDWDELIVSYRDLKERYAIATTQAEIRNLEMQRAEISYKSGSKPLQTLLEARLARLIAQLEAITARNNYYEARVKVRSLSGELLQELIKVEYGDVEKN